MNYNFVTTAGLSFVFVLSTWCYANDTSHLKHPPKPKPQPEELTLPAPYDQWDECDLLSKVYPAYNCDTGSIGKKNVDGEEEAEDQIADVKQISLWKTNGLQQLLVLVEIRFAGWHENASGYSSKSVDLALFEQINSKLTLAAFTHDVVGSRQFGNSKFDLAPYKLTSKETAIGIRWSPGINGIGEQYLNLYRLQHNTFHEIFSYLMWKETGDTEKKSILQVLPNLAGMNDFLLVTQTYHLNEDQEREKNMLKKQSQETWRWDKNSQSYKLAK